MKVPCKDKGPSLISSQKFTVHGHVALGRESRDEMTRKVIDRVENAINLAGRFQSRARVGIILA